MDRRALTKATYRLEAARHSLDAMRAAKDDGSFLQREWTNFVMAIGTTYTVLEQGAKASKKSIAWFATVKSLRRSDELLCYLHHARNSEEHGLDLSAKDWGPKLRVTNAYLKPEQRKGKRDIRQFRDEQGRQVLEYSAAVPGLIRVTDRGRTYDPPKSHLGSEIEGLDPLVVANLALTYLEGVTKEATELADELNASQPQRG